MRLSVRLRQLETFFFGQSSPQIRSSHRKLKNKIETSKIIIEKELSWLSTIFSSEKLYTLFFKRISLQIKKQVLIYLYNYRQCFYNFNHYTNQGKVE